MPEKTAHQMRKKGKKKKNNTLSNNKKKDTVRDQNSPAKVPNNSIRSTGAKSNDREREYIVDSPSQNEEPINPDLEGQTAGRNKYRHVFNILLILVVSLIALWFTDYLNAEKLAVSKFYGLFSSQTSNIAFVEITDTDYQKYFGSKSPLDAENLSLILAALIQSKPKVIGIARDTSDSSFTNFKIPESSAPIVWGMTPVTNKKGEFDHVLSSLGNQTPNNRLEGVSFVLQDPETNALCCYQRYIEIAKDTFVETFAHKLLLVSHPSFQNANGSATQYFLKLKDDEPDTKRLFFTAEQLLEESKTKEWQENNPLRDKIVILGGSYIGQEKIFITYNGNYKGYELHAAAIETELNGINLQPTPWYFRILIMLVFCFLSIVIFHVFEKQFFTAVGISIGVFLVLSFLLSFLRYGNIYGMIQYLPAFLYMLIAKIADYLYYKDNLVDYLYSFANISKRIVWRGTMLFH